jgi:serine/threonine protein kinase
MHDQGIIHGDLKGVGVLTPPFTFHADVRGPKDNILVHRDGYACLADFSLVTTTSDQQTFLSSCIEGGTTHWMSPELLDPGMFGLKKRRSTKESDCYALGMVIYEVLSGQTPFSPSKAPVVMRKVLNGERPEKPQGNGGKYFTDGIWRVMQFCWKSLPRDRIRAKDILLGLEGNPAPSRLSSDVDEDMEIDRDDQSDTTASDSGAFFPFDPKYISNHTCAIIGPQIADGDNELPVPPRAGNPRQGWLVRNTQKVFKAIAKAFSEL